MNENKLPESFVERLKVLYPNNSVSVIDSFNYRKPSTFRVNTLKTSAVELLKRLRAQGFEAESTDIPNAYILTTKTQRELTDTVEYNEGLLYIQGLSSMIPPILLDPKPNESILDVCSAPGSKTTQIAALMENTGQIVANDMSRIRLYKLQANIKTLGATNITTMHMKAQDLWRRFPNSFDRVLVDVPCSLEGRFLSSNPKSYFGWSVKKVNHMAGYQKQILHSAVSCAKPGGIIVYSTCTASPEENEAVIDWFISKHKEVVSVENISEMPEILVSGPDSWMGKNYDKEVLKTKRIVPSQTMEAFYVAKLRKN